MSKVSDVQRFMDAMFGEYNSMTNSQTWVSPNWAETKAKVATSLEAVSSIHEAEPVTGRKVVADYYRRGGNHSMADEILRDNWRNGASQSEIDLVAAIDTALAHPAPISKGVTVKALIDYLWQEFCELPDRTSPEEYPDMAMLTLKELTAIVETFFERPCLSHTAGEIE